MLRIGILGAARIAPKAVLGPAGRRDDVTVTCVGASSRERAAAFAQEHGIAHVADSYDALVTHPEVDLVYVALRPSAHREWSIAAMEAGKDVLCEKPSAMNSSESRAMVDAGKRTGRLFIEGFHYRYHPFFERVLEVLASGIIGTPRNARSRFDAPIDTKPGQFRFNRSMGGGAMMDLGCYTLHWARHALGGDPVEVVRAVAELGEDSVDIALGADLMFPGDVPVELRCSMSAPDGFQARLEIEGTKGRLVADNCLNPHNHNYLEVETDQGKAREELPGLKETGRLTFDYQLAAVVEAVKTRELPVTSGDDTVANMAWIDAIYRAAGLPRE